MRRLKPAFWFCRFVQPRSNGAGSFAALPLGDAPVPIVADVVAPAKVVISPTAAAITAIIPNSSDLVFNVTNTGGMRSAPLAATIAPADPEFAVNAATCAAGLAPLATCPVTVAFKPADRRRNLGQFGQITTSNPPKQNNMEIH